MVQHQVGRVFNATFPDARYIVCGMRYTCYPLCWQLGDASDKKIMFQRVAVAGMENKTSRWVGSLGGRPFSNVPISLDQHPPNLRK